MSKAQIIQRASSRMWLIHVPLIVVLLVSSMLCSGADNGLAALLALVAGAGVLCALIDWFGAEFAATRAD